MEKINMTGISYQIDADGNTQAVVVTYSSPGGTNNFNSSIYITEEDLEEGVTLDDLTRKEFDTKAREMFKTWIDMV